MANYTQRREAWITAGIDAGVDIGTQRMADLMALALNDPEVTAFSEGYDTRGQLYE